MSSEEQITNDDIMQMLAAGRGLLAGCNIRPEAPADRPIGGGIPPTVYIDAVDGTAEQFAVKLWQHILKDGAE